MANIPKRILLGRILGAHGIRGEVLIKTYTGEPEAIADYGALTDQDGSNPVELTVQRNTSKGVVAKIKNVNDRNGAEALKGRELYVERSQFPEPGGDEFYHVDLIGLQAQNEQGIIIGTIIDVANYGAGDILEIKLSDTGDTELIPFTPAFVPDVDLDKKTVTVVLAQNEGNDTPT